MEETQYAVTLAISVVVLRFGDGKPASSMWNGANRSYGSSVDFVSELGMRMGNPVN